MFSVDALFTMHIPAAWGPHQPHQRPSRGAQADSTSTV